ncbi:MAG: hypothetical protein JXA30_07475 [Deltaproteobacteria bacterium]|nr:hypothetical protein [Deltaproteobacteria bacterium]
MIVSDAGLEPPCFDPNEVIEACGDVDIRFGVRDAVELADESILGNSARFVAVGGRAVLGERTDRESWNNRWAVVTLHEPTHEEYDKGFDSITKVHEIEWPEKVDGFEVLDVWSDFGVRFDDIDIFALLCTSSVCTIAGADSNSDEPLTPLPNLVVPNERSFDRIITGSAVDSSIGKTSSRICVFGDGLLCHDGESWQIEIAPGTVPRLRSVVMEDPFIAVGERGTILVRTALERPWEAIKSGATETLIGASTFIGNFSVIGEDGYWYKSTGYGATSCRQSPPLVFTEQGIVVDSTGRGYVEYWNYDVERYFRCELSKIDSQPFKAFSALYCRSTKNFFAITENRLYGLTGELICAIYQ